MVQWCWWRGYNDYVRGGVEWVNRRPFDAIVVRWRRSRHEWGSRLASAAETTHDTRAGVTLWWYRTPMMRSIRRMNGWVCRRHIWRFGSYTTSVTSGGGDNTGGGAVLQPGTIRIRHPGATPDFPPPSLVRDRFQSLVSRYCVASGARPDPDTNPDAPSGHFVLLTPAPASVLATSVLVSGNVSEVHSWWF